MGSENSQYSKPLFGIGGNWASTSAPGSMPAPSPSVPSDSGPARDPYAGMQPVGSEGVSDPQYTRPSMVTNSGPYNDTGAGHGATHDVHPNAQDGGQG